ncbi:MAG: pimeloyl-CoA dehydrogenase large subunit [Sphingomonadales bacterium 35-56-22]|mgnify:FL=1|jgi:alkylation response protein AidB-like acyl-CoA dehydrogenase|uniref:acyl-CoA dehydrogenase family protein n=1 Tax=Sphingorhabdus sp. TaxID=1902408 RepID=UPI000BC4A290|nr:acyl-CoA dehydrogenase family protein [Sphingorhabdus sp.]OYY15651.1 MAG: pimeloyl-CoA dehydrogenase large subunit [Sphingomonadales bacterium 35-56-22]OYY98071.1 MAG: pimeloyl-CoA dehydrogenase large subunit [Sphingomonadales bacterium 28-56-43]OYZ60554.1 MAG: pimeloyl-CoA dehydrogenase large subunit [Sphingomonadales bacterium 24-56-14]OZA83028.1 MAG: pimeloyl-CoA dehydrogenase large subunit [Sphingomonadales bacterium 39-57-19]HQS13236.1 acyl-CoA dehydrogenase family protein [Sphingorhab
MQLEFSPEEIAFQKEVRTFIAENYPENLRSVQDEGHDLSKEDFLSWHRILAKKGWIAPAWPVEYGGTGWTATQRFIWSEELAAADCVGTMPFGLSMVGPVIYTFGTPEQKAQFLPGILSGDDWWCQGYSEPGAGSDLASLRTKAVRDGDHYVVNGQKTWTTMAQYADWGFFLVRTDSDAKAQEGISFLLINMKTPGVTVRPIITLGGEHEVNEVWLEDVRVPVANRIYEENKGWTCAKFLLAHERTGIAAVARSKRGVEKIKSIARTEQDGDRPLIANPFFKRKISELEIDLTALEFTELRSLAGEAAGKGPGPESSLLKIKGSEIQQRITELALEAVGHYGAPYFRGFGEGDNEHPIGPDYAHRAAPTYFNTRKTTIYGGSNEIQRNIIAKMVLGI